MFADFSVSASGLEAQRLRLNTISSNLSNVNTTRGLNGEPYRRRDVVFEADHSFNKVLNNAGYSIPVKVKGVVEDMTPFKTIYEPGHPDANQNGYLQLPNVNVVEEMVNMISAMRAYDASISAFKTSRDMMNKALNMGR
ncbi:MAG: flagellar basal body rod protein FlgC [Proteobacteria bacterium]|nr:flagellar basal body rod protein FlgC [Pseudomonadota bacterium]